MCDMLNNGAIVQDLNASNNFFADKDAAFLADTIKVCSPSVPFSLNIDLTRARVTEHGLAFLDVFDVLTFNPPRLSFCRKIP